MSIDVLPPSQVILGMMSFFVYSYIINKYQAKFDKTTCSTKTCTPSSSFQKCYGQNYRRKRGSISCFWSKTLFTIAKTIQICICPGTPYLSTYCINYSFFHEQLLWRSYLIFSYIWQWYLWDHLGMICCKWHKDARQA